jgi:hypothetical protein
MPHQCTNCGKVFPDGSKEMLSGCPQCGGNKFQFRPRGAVDSSDGPARDTPDSSSATSRTDRGSAESSAAGAESSAVGAESSAAGAESSAADTDADASADDSTTVSEWVKQRADDVMGSSGSGQSGGSGQSASDTTVADGKSESTSGESTGEYDSGTETVSDTAAEDTAQASARSDVVSPDELARAVDRDDGAADDAVDDGPPVDVDGTVIEPQTDDRPGLDELREELNDQFESIKIINPGQYELNLMELYDRQEYVISLQEDGRYVIEVPDAWRTTGPDDE